MTPFVYWVSRTRPIGVHGRDNYTRSARELLAKAFAESCGLPVDEAVVEIYLDELPSAARRGPRSVRHLLKPQMDVQVDQADLAALEHSCGKPMFVVCDSLAAGSASLALADLFDARFVYVSHNNEATTRLGAAIALRSPLDLAEAVRVRLVERRLWLRADLITAISTIDRDAIRSATGGIVEWMPPPIELVNDSPTSHEVDGGRAPQPWVAGSFMWRLKRHNLDRLLTVLEPWLLANRRRLLVSGPAPAQFVEKLQLDRRVEYVGVTDLGTLARRADVGIVLEQLGGGFKMKILDYVAHRLPVIAFEDEIGDLPAGLGVAIARDEFTSQGVATAISQIGRMDMMAPADYFCDATEKARSYVSTIVTELGNSVWGSVASGSESGSPSVVVQ